MSKINSNSFNGPLFIIGMPRSGTKLLRELLNLNTVIGIPSWESHFIPYMTKKYGIEKNFYKKSDLKQFYRDFTQTTFFEGMKGFDYILEFKELHQNAKKDNISNLFEFILKFYAPKNRKDGFIWGDKTPGYIKHVLLLKTLYPGSKFLHIIRDPRDVALSVRKTWMKSIYRASERWRDTINEVTKSVTKNNKIDMLFIHYENLIENTEEIIKEICIFLEINYSESMIKLKSPTENYGSATGKVGILKENKNKFKKFLSKNEIKRIEEIIYPIGIKYGYKMLYAEKFKKLNLFDKIIYKIYDIITVYIII